MNKHSIRPEIDKETASKNNDNEQVEAINEQLKKFGYGEDEDEDDDWL